MAKKRKTYFIKEETINTIEEIEANTGLKKSTILDKAIEAYKNKKSNENN